MGNLWGIYCEFFFLDKELYYNTTGLGNNVNNPFAHSGARLTKT